MTSVANPASASHGRGFSENLAGRRLLVAGLNTASWICLAWVMARLVGAGGWSWLPILIMILFLAGLPWALMGFWNAVIGFVILRLVRDAASHTNPCLRNTTSDSEIAARTAICLPVRHEDVDLVIARLETMIESLEASPWADRFCFHFLSDSSKPEIVAVEKKAFAALARRHPQAGFLNYRRRPDNSGFKAGNLREFALRRRRDFDYMIVLDADSMMSAAAVFRLVRVMQANPRLGILQTLVVGQPANCAFTRIFQFGMRHGMRTHTVGIAWWQGPSGPYWGHNAIIRLDPFVAACGLPTLHGRPPLGGPVLSHDQVEAALMQAAGYEVRVIAEEFESWEENPPSLPDFIKRDLRWCQGNLQYLKLIAMPGLRPMGRFQLISATMMYLGAPLWFLMLAAGLGLAVVHSAGVALVFPTGLAFGLYVGMLAVGFAPRFLGVLDILLRPAQWARYGGVLHLLAGTLTDALFTLLIGPLIMIAQVRFETGLLIGRRIAWDAQKRDGQRISVGEASRGLWPQMLFGVLFAGLLAGLAPEALPWAAPTLLASALAIPFTCITTSRTMSRWMVRHRLCAVPDEFETSPVLRRLSALTSKLRNGSA
jgi:membrane glycosyltransferase